MRDWRDFLTDFRLPRQAGQNMIMSHW